MFYNDFLTTLCTISGCNPASSIIGRKNTSTKSIKGNSNFCFIIDVTEDPLLLLGHISPLVQG